MTGIILWLGGMFPVSVTGSIRLKLGAPPSDRTVKAVVDRIVDMLDAASATEAWTENNQVRFKVSIFRLIWNWNILVPFNAGRFVVVPEDLSLVVRYSLSVLRMFLFVTLILAALLVFFFWQSTDRMEALRTDLPGLGLAWLWLFGVNYLITMIRMPLWLRRGLRRDPELKRQRA